MTKGVATAFRLVVAGLLLRRHAYLLLLLLLQVVSFMRHHKQLEVHTRSGKPYRWVTVHLRYHQLRQMLAARHPDSTGDCALEATLTLYRCRQLRRIYLSFDCICWQQQQLYQELTSTNCLQAGASAACVSSNSCSSAGATP
jgi:hypothetical protein